MGSYIDKLVLISSDQLSQGKVALPLEILELAGELGNELEDLLNVKNGFFAFESALRVFPSLTSENSIGLVDWNADSLWRKDYSGFTDGALFFAEDIFGGQFCIKNNVICSFDPETGAFEEMASNFESWVQELLSDYNVWTGYSLAHEWQEAYGSLPNDMRLMPKVPFVCGGAFELDNLSAIKAVSGMRTRANLACQIANLPDGAQIEFKIIE